MKIFFLINSLHTSGGTERVTTIIANELSKKGFEVGIIALHGGGSPFFELLDKIELFYINPSGYKSIYTHFLSNLYRLRIIYVKHAPNIVIDVCSAMSLLSIPATIFTNIKVITWEHFNSNIDWNPITTPLSRYLAAKRSNMIITLTQRDAENYKQRYKALNVISISNPITCNTNSQALLNQNIVLAIGRLTEQKGFDMLIKAWHLITKDNKNWKLRIVGGGEMETQLLEMIDFYHLNKTIELLPPTNDVVSLYKNASIYVMSSRFEGLPLVLIEAMSMGLPIVSFDCETGPRELIENDVTGVLVPSNDIEKLASELNLLMNDKERQLRYGKNALLKSKDYEIEPIIKKWIDILCL